MPIRSESMSQEYEKLGALAKPTGRDQLLSTVQEFLDEYAKWAYRVPITLFKGGRLLPSLSPLVAARKPFCNLNQ